MAGWIMFHLLLGDNGDENSGEIDDGRQSSSKAFTYTFWQIDTDPHPDPGDAITAVTTKYC